MRAHVTPAFPHFAAVLVPVFSLSSSGALVCVVHGCFFFFTARRLSLPLARRSVLCPPPTSPRHLLAVLAPFLGGWGRRGWAGGAPSLFVLRRKHVASTAQARGAALVPLQGRGACRVATVVALPSVRSPVAPPAGACTARASFGHGRAVHPAPSLRCLPTLPLCPREGGPLSAPPFLHPPPLGGRKCVEGGGLVVFPSLHACRRHDASTAQARGAAPVPLQGGGHAL